MVPSWLQNERELRSLVPRVEVNPRISVPAASRVRTSVVRVRVMHPRILRSESIYDICEETFRCHGYFCLEYASSVLLALKFRLECDPCGSKMFKQLLSTLSVLPSTGRGIKAPDGKGPTICLAPRACVRHLLSGMPEAALLLTTRRYRLRV